MAKPSTMKKSNLKTPRRKIIPHHYQKHTSLSQLLAAASYKKRINDLTRNNTCLALALQATRYEAATQEKLLKDYSKDSNCIMYARKKLKDIASSVAKIVTDLDEVMNYLDTNAASVKIPLFPKDKSPSEARLKVKVPSISIIEETSTISEHETSVCGTSPTINSSEVFQSEVNDNAKLSSSSAVDIPVSDENVDVAPLLFVDEAEGQNERVSSRKSKSSKRRSNHIQMSLTPQLSIEHCYKDKRSSSLKQFQPDNVSFRQTRSCGRRSEAKALISPITDEDKSNANTSEIQQKKKSKSEGIHNKRKRGPSSEQSESEAPLIADPSTPILELPVCQSPVQVLPSVEVSDEIISAPIDSVPVSPVKSVENVLSSVETNNVISQPVHLIPPALVSHAITNTGITSVTLENKTLLLYEDMELTDVIPGLGSVAISNATIPDNSGNVESKSNICASNVKSPVTLSQEGDDKNGESGKSDQNITCTDATELYDVKMCINNPGNITFGIPENDGNKNLQHSEDKSLCNQSLSPVPAYSFRNKKPTKCIIFSSDDDSEDDFTPLKKGSCKQKKRVTAVYRPNAAHRTPKSLEADYNVQNNSLPAADTSFNRMSVFDFNASVSEICNSKEGKQKRSRKKTSKSKELPAKSLSKRCTVTKLKGFDYKFNKDTFSANNNESNNVGGNLIKTKMKSGKKSITVDTLSNSKAVDNDVSEEVMGENLDSSADRIICSKELDLSAVSLTPNSEAKRVSFATTDLVCNFRRMSQSKTISINKKVSQTSKCLSELEEEVCFLKSDNVREKRPDVDDSGSLFDFSDETELYTMKLPSSFIYPLPKPINLQSQKLDTSFIEEKESASKRNNNNDEINDDTNKKIPEAKKKSLKKDSNIKSSSSVKSQKSSYTKKEVLLQKDKGSNCKENVVVSNFETLHSVNTKNVISKNITPSSLSSKENRQSKLSGFDPNNSSIGSNKSEKKKNINKCKTFPKASVTEKSKKRCNVKSANSSPILKDIINLEHQNSEDHRPVTVDELILPRRRSKPISYKELPLNKKLRRE